MRELRHVEKKLLKKQDFFDWSNVSSIKKQQVVQRYRLGSRKDYDAYNVVVGYVTKLVAFLERLPADDSFRLSVEAQLAAKLFDAGLIAARSIELAKKITVSAFLRRRLIVQVRLLKFVETLQEAETFINHGHFMIGNEVVRDPDLLVPRKMAEHISWNDRSKIKRKVGEFNNQADDFEALN